jgi:integrase
MPHLTDKLIRGIQSPIGKRQIRLVDDEITGFGIRVTAKGARTFFLNYTVDGRERRMSIGGYPTWSVAAAREKAKELRRLVDSGVDPLEQKDRERAMLTVAELWERYDQEVLAHKAEKTAIDQRSICIRLVLPEIGSRKANSIDYADIERLHAKVSNGTRVQANRMIALLRHMFGRAVRWGITANNPVAGIKQNSEHPRERMLSKNERKCFEETLSNLPDDSAKLAIEMLYLTGARKSEVLHARWDQFDLEDASWTKPSAHTKQRKIHRIPLHQRSLEVLQRAKAFGDGDYVFPSKNGQPLNDIRRTFSKVCIMAGIENFRVHDLRHSFASLLAEAGIDLLAIGKLLGHTQTATTSRYAHLQQDTLRKATELAWTRR